MLPITTQFQWLQVIGGESLDPRLSVYRNGSFLIRYRFTGESTRGDQAAQQAVSSWFLRGQQGKIKERQT